MMYSMDDIFLFIKVVEVGSFIGTAKLLRIGQSTVSRRMKELENQLKISLFRQHNKGYELTPAGLNLYNDIKDYRYELESVINKHIKYREHPKGTIKVALPTVLSMDLIAPYIADFLEQYPDINLETCFVSGEVDLVRDGFSMAIINHMPSQQTMKIKHVFTANYMLYCTHAYQEKYGIPKTLKDLNNHLVTGIINEDYSTNENVAFTLLKTGQVVVIDMPRRIRVNNMTLGMQMMYSNKVIAGILSTVKLNNDLVSVLPEYSVGQVKFYMLKHPHEDSYITQIFCDFLEDIFRKYNRNSD